MLETDDYAVSAGEGSSAVASKGSSEVINVRVSRRVLWIGSDAYPLQNIARAQARKITPPRGTPVRDYIKAVFGWLILGIILSAILGVAAHSGALAALVWVAVVALLVWRTIQLVRKLNLDNTYYALIIETAGNPNTALVSRDADVVSELVQEIMAAIDNPSAEFSQNVTNYHLGDKITQYGNSNIGKIAS
jgi:uncharacterized protein DUF6232